MSVNDCFSTVLSVLIFIYKDIPDESFYSPLGDEKSVLALGRINAQYVLLGIRTVQSAYRCVLLLCLPILIYSQCLLRRRLLQIRVINES